jgi:hypothetical protein
LPISAATDFAKIFRSVPRIICQIGKLFVDIALEILMVKMKFLTPLEQFAPSAINTPRPASRTQNGKLPFCH